MVAARLKAPLAIGNHVVAPAGTPVEIHVVDAKPADNPDIYGFVDIYFEPMKLPDGSVIPLQPPTSRLSVDPSAGHESTAALENTIGDIFLPTAIFHAFRKGRNFTLQPGAEIRALTEAQVALTPNGTVAVSTPAPLVLDVATPHSTFNSSPLATPNPGFRAPIDRATPMNPSTPHPR